MKHIAETIQTEKSIQINQINTCLMKHIIETVQAKKSI